MSEAHEFFVATLDRLDERFDVVVAADLAEHVNDGFVGATVAGAIERPGGGSNGGVRIGVARTDDAHGGRRTVLLVVGVQDEECVEGLGEDRVRLVVRLGHLPHHRQEVLGVGQLVVGVDERHSDARPVGHGSDGRALGNESVDLLVAVDRIVDVLCLRVEGRQCGDTGDEHAHGVSIVMEALHEAATHVLVDVGVVRDVVGPGVELVLLGQLAEEQEVADLEERGVLRQLLDGVAPVAEDAVAAVELGDLALGGGGDAEPRIEEPDTWQELRPCLGVDTTVHDRDFDGFAGPVVGNGDRILVSHGGSTPDWSRLRVSMTVVGHAVVPDRATRRSGCPQAAVQLTGDNVPAQLAWCQIPQNQLFVVWSEGTKRFRAACCRGGVAGAVHAWTRACRGRRRSGGECRQARSPSRSILVLLLGRA